MHMYEFYSLMGASADIGNDSTIEFYARREGGGDLGTLPPHHKHTHIIPK